MRCFPDETFLINTFHFILDWASSSEVQLQTSSKIASCYKQHACHSVGDMRCSFRLRGQRLLTALKVSIGRRIPVVCANHSMLSIGGQPFRNIALEGNLIVHKRQLMAVLEEPQRRTIHSWIISWSAIEEDECALPFCKWFILLYSNGSSYMTFKAIGLDLDPCKYRLVPMLLVHGYSWWL